MVQSGTASSVSIQQETAEEMKDPYVTIVWDDSVNLMSYVTYVFCAYFKYSKSKAEKLMLKVHYDGKAIVAQGNREQMEKDVAAMHSYGLLASLDKAN